MKKFFASATFVILFGIYTAYQYTSSASTANYTAPTASSITVTQPVAVAATTQSAQTQAQSASQTQTSVGSQAQSSQDASAQSSAQAQTPPAAVASTQTPSGQYVDGTYTGTVANAYYGYVQVQATISGGKLVDVAFLQYPNDRSTSRYINSQAMPALKSEAISAQSASVNGVSGATDTSAAFRQSLASALSQAKS